MSLNLSQLTGKSVVDRATEPRRIFAALPAKDPRYGYPRDVQTEIWEAWHDRRDSRDLVIKMNTGGGKTVVGLTILKSCLNEGVGPAVYITPNTYLNEQVTAEAVRLGLPVTDDPRNTRFQSGKAILVVNIAKLVNGRSVFGLRGDTRPRIKLGAVVVDDAHACVTTIADQFTLRIPSNHAVFQPLLSLFADDLRAQSATAFLDVTTGDPSAVMRIPYWAWIDRQQEVLSILHPHREDPDLEWSWPLVRDSLALTRPVVSSDGFEIAPPCPAIDEIPSFAEATRRIYMTATLADDSILVTHCGADPASITVPITPRSAGDLGDRMILTPLDTFPTATDTEIRDMLVAQATRHNVVVIVPSRRRAEWWRPYAAATYDATNIGAGVESLKAGHVGLVVFINKYDGVDLADDACRILAIDGLPEAYSGLDRLEALALDDTQSMVTRQMQRIEQGMGRGIRSNEDYCVVLLLGARLTQRLFQMGSAKQLSPGTRAQMDLSAQVAEMLRGRPFSDLSSAIAQCLGRDPGWVTASRDALDSVSYEPSSIVSAVAVSQRRAFEAAQAGRFTDSASILQQAIDDETDLKLRGWLKELAAGYLHHFDKVKAQRMQASAKSDNRALLTPRKGADYKRLTGLADQAMASAKFLADTYAGGAELVIGLAALLTDLEMGPDDVAATKRFEKALHELGLHLGIPSQRPDQELGVGPDVLWATDHGKYLVIECKSGASTSFISKKDAAQLSQSMDWFEQTYPGAQAVPVILHPTSRLHNTATMPSSARVITAEKLVEVRTAVTDLGTALAVDAGYRDPAVVEAQLHILHLRASAFIQHFGLLPRPGRS